MTPFAVTAFWVLTTLNGAGQLAPLEKADMVPGMSGPIAWSEGQCNFMRGKMPQPEKYVCQLFKSAPSVNWTLPKDAGKRCNPATADDGTC